eukprot:366487-Chlamydomonas_euryale.AAC.4
MRAGLMPLRLKHAPQFTSGYGLHPALLQSTHPQILKTGASWEDARMSCALPAAAAAAAAGARTARTRARARARAQHDQLAGELWSHEAGPRPAGTERVRRLPGPTSRRGGARVACAL